MSTAILLSLQIKKVSITVNLRGDFLGVLDGVFFFGVFDMLELQEAVNFDVFELTFIVLEIK